MSDWIVSSNIKVYDVKGDFAKLGKVNWYQNQPLKNIAVGDSVYLYLSTPIKEIKWKCVVNAVGFYLQPDDEDTHSPIQTTQFCDGPFIEMVPILEFQLSNKLSYKDLKQNGLKSMLMSAERVSPQVLAYIQSIENIEQDDSKLEDQLLKLPPADLKSAAIAASTKSVVKVSTVTKQYMRNSCIALYAKYRAEGKCQLCGNDAPFSDERGNPYLESHHIVWLSNGGEDSVDNTVALCPNCHRKMHVLNDEKDIAYLKSLTMDYS